MKPNPKFLTMKSYFVHPDGKIIDCMGFHEGFVMDLLYNEDKLTSFCKNTRYSKEKFRKKLRRMDLGKEDVSLTIESLMRDGWFTILTTGKAEMAIRGLDITPAKLEKLELVLLKHDLISDEIRIIDDKSVQNAYFYTRKVKGFADAWRKRMKLNPKYKYGDFVYLKKDAEVMLSTGGQLDQDIVKEEEFWAVDDYEPESGMLNINRVEDPYPGAYCSWVHESEVIPVEHGAEFEALEKQRKSNKVKGDKMRRKRKRRNPFEVATSKWGKMDDASKKGDAGAFVEVEILPAIKKIDIEEYKTENPDKNSLCITVNQLLNLAFDSLPEAEPIEGDTTHFMYKGNKLSKNTVHHKVIKMLESQGFTKLTGSKGVYCIKV